MVTIIPVIHYDTFPQVMRNAELAFDAGCSRIVLIDMEPSRLSSATSLIDAAVQLKAKYPDKHIGANFLFHDVSKAIDLAIDHHLDFTWTDEQLTYSHWSKLTLERVTQENEIISARLKNNSHSLFCGVAFKGQRTEPFPWLAADRALKLGFIPTTSGTDTGREAGVSYIADLRRRMRVDGSLAIASGITPENVSFYTPYVTHIFVATGISKSFYEFDKAKLNDLMKEVQ